MSITKDFEKKFMKEMELRPPYSLKYYNDFSVEELLAHTRALEAMLKKHQWDWDGLYCFECGYERSEGHKSDCQLAKLLEGVE